MKKILIAAFALVAVFLPASNVNAANSSWDKCLDGTNIVRCETLECPKGDTNGDGQCTLADDGASVTQSRNDSFCGDPLVGCGQVNYYNSSANSCLVRVKQETSSCNLYKVSNIVPTPVPTASPTPTPDPSPKPENKKLPETGPGLQYAFGVVTLAVAGFYLFNRK